MKPLKEEPPTSSVRSLDQSLAGETTKEEERATTVASNQRSRAATRGVRSLSTPPGEPYNDPEYGRS